MFAVEDILVSDEVLEAPFCCHLGHCLGGCCVQGDSGAPLEADERVRLEAVLPHVYADLRPEAQAVIAERGVWEETDDGYATTCVGTGACVFVTYDGPVAKCAIQQAYRDGRVDFEKPVSCHLYPLRASRYGRFEVLNYERIELCNPARAHGVEVNVQLADFLQAPLVRKYGEAWYDAFRSACAERREELYGSSRRDR